MSISRSPSVSHPQTPRISVGGSRSEYRSRSTVPIQIRHIYHKPKSFKKASWAIFFLTVVIAFIVTVSLRQRIRFIRSEATGVTQSHHKLEPINPDCFTTTVKIENEPEEQMMSPRVETNLRFKKKIIRSKYLI